MERNKILVIQTAFLGDAILTLPIIQKLKETETDASIDVLCIPGTQEVFKNSPYVNNTIVYDKRGEHKSITQLFALGGRLRSHNYSKIISPHRSLRTTILVFLSRVKETYGFDKSSLSILYKHRVKYDNNVHEVERNLTLIGADTRGTQWKVLPIIETPASAKSEVELFLKTTEGNKYAAVAPGSVWATKVYPKEYFKELVKELLDSSFTVLLLGGKNDMDLCVEMEKNFTKSVYSTAGKFTIIESIELLRKCEILISNDSAPTHMGMCADIPTLTIYCSTIPGFGFYPYNNKSRCLSYSELDCKPCGIHGHQKCPTGTFDCAKLLLPSKAIQEISEMLA